MARRNRRISGNGLSSTERSRPRKPISQTRMPAARAAAPWSPALSTQITVTRWPRATKRRAQHQDLPFRSAAVQAADHQGYAERAVGWAPALRLAAVLPPARCQQAQIRGPWDQVPPPGHPPAPGDDHVGKSQRRIADRGRDAAAANADPRQED